jgi:hypothetical protein
LSSTISEVDQFRLAKIAHLLGHELNQLVSKLQSGALIVQRGDFADTHVQATQK